MNPFEDENFSAWGMPPQQKSQDLFPVRDDPPSRMEQINNLLDEYIKQKEALKACQKGKGGAKLKSTLNKVIQNIEEKLIDLK